MPIDARDVRLLLSDAKRLTVQEQLGVMRVLSWLDLDRPAWGALAAAAFRVTTEMQASPPWRRLARKVSDHVRLAAASPRVVLAANTEGLLMAELIATLEHGQLGRLAEVDDRVTLTRQPAHVVDALRQAIELVMRIDPQRPA